MKTNEKTLIELELTLLLKTTDKLEEDLEKALSAAREK